MFESDSQSGGFNRRADGSQAEALAAKWLSEQGYQILARNVFTSAGELDLIARQGETLCFIEVKARRSDEFGEAIEAVTRQKQQRIFRCAQAWLLDNPWDGECRFDVVGLDQKSDEFHWTFTLIQDAFQAGS